MSIQARYCQGDDRCFVILSVGTMEWTYEVNLLHQVTRCAFPPSPLNVSYEVPKLLWYWVSQALNKEAESISIIARAFGQEIEGEGITRSINFTNWLISNEFHLREEVNLQNLALSSLPPQLGLFKKAKKLNLSGNSLRLFPPELLKLSALEELDLSGNPFWDIPDLSCHLPSLRILRLNEMTLTSVPDWIQRLENLEQLELVGNRIETLPSWVEDWPASRTLIIDHERNSSQLLPPSNSPMELS